MLQTLLTAKLVNSEARSNVLPRLLFFFATSSSHLGSRSLLGFEEKATSFVFYLFLVQFLFNLADSLLRLFSISNLHFRSSNWTSLAFEFWSGNLYFYLSFSWGKASGQFDVWADRVTGILQWHKYWCCLVFDGLSCRMYFQLCLPTCCQVFFTS